MRLTFTILALVLAAAAGSLPVTPHAEQSAGARSADDTGLVGIWGAESSYGPLVRGELTVLRTGTGWTARVAGFELAPRTARDSMWILVPGGLGEFRGRMLPDSQTIVGFWVQPPGVVGGTFDAFPLRLERAALGRMTSVWRGVVVPLDDRFSLYLIVTRRPDGRLLGSFHNPEANSRGGAAAFAIEQVGATVRFTDTAAGPAHNPAAPIVATYDSLQRQLIVPWADLGRPVVLTRRGRDDAIGLYPRAPAGPAYRYRTPPPGDGWTAARAASVGLDEDRLAGLVQYVANGDPTVDTTPLIQSILVARHGKLVLEEYFFGFDRSRPHDLRSASKAFASVLVGAAIMHGAAIGPATPVYAAFHDDAPFANPDPRKQQITLGQAMTHSTGLACDDNGDAQPGNEDVMQAQRGQPDWYKFTLDLPMMQDPGRHYAYCSATMNLAGGVVAAVEHTWLPALFDRWVAGPLQFQRYDANLMPNGQAYFGGGMQLLPRDFLKLGVAYLGGGLWNGTRVVTRKWVEQSTAQQIGPPEASGVDGYAWHLHTLTSGSRTFREYEANGNGGQYLIVLPDLDLAMVMTGGDYSRYSIRRRWRDVLVPDYIIAAATRGDK